MTGRSGRGRWERVLAARRQADDAVGRPAGSPAGLGGPPGRRTQPLPAPGPRLAALHPSERSEVVLSLGEAADRLGLSRAELEAMIDALKVEALPTGFTRNDSDTRD